MPPQQTYVNSNTPLTVLLYITVILVFSGNGWYAIFRHINVQKLPGFIQKDEPFRKIRRKEHE